MTEVKIITKHWGTVNPFLIDSYIHLGGYGQFLHCLKKPVPAAEIIAAIEHSGLRGRGGGGFLTGKKWKLAAEAAKAKNQKPYLIVNGDESEPGTFKDRAIIEKNPHAVLEGALIGAYAIGAEQVFIYINGRYREQFHIMERTVAAARQHNFVGEKIAGTSVNIEVEVIAGPGGYICGEETALINTLESRRPEPRLRPPYATTEGLWGRPTIVNNVETIANIAPILEMGPAAYAGLGVKCNGGTKLFSVSGPVLTQGIFELPLGSSPKELIEDYCGGLKPGKRIRFVQVGGAAGPFLKPRDLKKRFSYDIGPDTVWVGSGAVLVVDQLVSIEDLLVSWAQFYRRESCGQCTPCREGTYQLFKIAERIKRGSAFKRDSENARDLIQVLQKTSLCPLGMMAGTSFENMIAFFGDEIFKIRNRPRR